MILSPITVFAWSFCVALLGGMWAATNPNRPVKTLREFAHWSLGPALVGLGLTIFLYERWLAQGFGQLSLIGGSLLIGMGGKGSVRFVLRAVRREILTAGADSDFDVPSYRGVQHDHASHESPSQPDVSGWGNTPDNSGWGQSGDDGATTDLH